MGREVRKVPAGWRHPKNADGHFVPLFGRDVMQYHDPADGPLNPADYMPEWADADATHYMMYETTTEGTPLSPAFATPEELAHWLAGTNASAFGSQGASYETWLVVACGTFAPSAVYTPQTGLISGVEAVGYAAD